jgi:acyl-CoA synthetase (AMP-forming)/AMP-acid ligase II
MEGKKLMLVHDLLFRSSVLHGDKVAIVNGRERVTYTTLANSARQVAAWLLEHGMDTGDRVAILSDNPTQYIAAFFGILQAGGIAVGLNTQTSERSLNTVLSDCGASFVLVSGRCRKYQKYIQAHPDVKKNIDVFSLLDAGDSASADEISGPKIKPNHIAQIIYTSGTTGHPKGVMLRHSNLTANTRSIVEYMDLTHLDTAMAVLPFFYSYGNSVMLTHIAVGGTLVVNQSFVYPNLILEQMVNEQVTGLAGVPSTFAILLYRSAVGDYSFPHLRYLAQAGAAMSPRLAEKLSELFSDARIFIMYGQTEASPRLSFLEPKLLRKKPGSIGKAIPGVTLELVKKDGTLATTGEVGEIVARGDNIMAGYWQRPEETKAVLRDGRLWTGDLAYSDEDGFLYIVSRKSDMIKCGSHRIAPKEIEDIIMELEAIHETVVVGAEDDILGELIHAYVVLKPEYPLTEKEIIRYCRRNLPAFKVPHHVKILEELPKTESGKVKKGELQS